MPGARLDAAGDVDRVRVASRAIASATLSGRDAAGEEERLRARRSSRAATSRTCGRCRRRCRRGRSRRSVFVSGSASPTVKAWIVGRPTSHDVVAVDLDEIELRDFDGAQDLVARCVAKDADALRARVAVSARRDRAVRVDVARRLGHEDEAEVIGAELDGAARASSARVMPQILTLRHPFTSACTAAGAVVLPQQRLADQKGVEARGAQALDVRARADAALRDADRVRRASARRGARRWRDRRGSRCRSRLFTPMMRAPAVTARSSSSSSCTSTSASQPYASSRPMKSRMLRARRGATPAAGSRPRRRRCRA